MYGDRGGIVIIIMSRIGGFITIVVVVVDICWRPYAQGAREVRHDAKDF